MNIVQHPVTNRLFKLARLRPEPDPDPVHFHHFAGKHRLAPETMDYTPAAASSLRRAYLNDRLGCCVIAGGAHVLGVLTANGGKEVILNRFEIIELYSLIGKYVPGQPHTDNGCDERRALTHFHKHGFLADGSHKIAGWMSVDGSHREELRETVFLTENLYFGVEMPDAWVNPMPAHSGFVWDVAGPALEENGHCFTGYGYTEEGVIIDSWGMTGLITWAAIARYATSRGSGELYTIVSKESINRSRGLAPNGLDWEALEDRLAKLAA